MSNVPSLPLQEKRGAQTYKLYPAEKWPDTTPYCTASKLRARIKALRKKVDILKKSKEHRTADGALSLQYQALKLELLLLNCKYLIAYTDELCTSSAYGTDDRLGDQASTICKLIQLDIALDDSLYNPRLPSPEKQAAKEKQLLDILELAGENVAPQIPKEGNRYETSLGSRNEYTAIL